ncbi:MAG: hypothetical protein GY710_08755 [Desulfobacteraceae bacterium]|nr:hypothetical protein [Desulfobacteraceae bacterium]
MNRTRAFAINSFSSAILQVVMVMVGLILPRIILSVYGSSMNGLVTSITQFVAYLSLVEAGLGGAAIYILYKPLADKDHDRTNMIVSTAKKFYDQAGVIFFILLLLIVILYPLLVPFKDIPPWQIGILVFSLGCKGLFDLLIMGKYRVLLSADQKIFVVSISTIASLILHTGIIVTMALYNINLILAYSLAIFALLAKAFILSSYVKHNYKYIQFNTKTDKSIIKQRWDVLYLQLLGSIQQGIPVIAITIFSTLQIVSIYSIYNMVILGLTGVLSIFINGLFASFGDVIAKNELPTLQKSYGEFEFSYYMIITWTSMCALFLIVPFVKIYTIGITDANYDQPIFGMLIVLNSFFYNIKTPQGMLVIAAGLYRETRWRTTIQGSIALICCLVFVKPWGLHGIMVGMLLSNIYRCIDLIFFIPKHVTHLPPSHSIIRILRMVFLMACAMTASNFLDITPQSFIEWFLPAILISLAAGIIVLAINYLFEPQLFRNIIIRIELIFYKKIQNECIK